MPSLHHNHPEPEERKALPAVTKRLGEFFSREGVREVVTFGPDGEMQALPWKEPFVMIDNHSKPDERPQVDATRQSVMPGMFYPDPVPIVDPGATKTYGERKPNRFKMEPGFVTCLGCGVSNATPMSAASAVRFFKKHGKCHGK